MKKYLLGILAIAVLIIAVSYTVHNYDQNNNDDLAAQVYDGATNEGNDNEGIIKRVEAVEFARIMKQNEPFVIDVRTPEEYSQGYLPGAVNIDYQSSDFAQQITALDREENYAIYCGQGTRSKEVLKLMELWDFENVVELKGGIKAWRTEDRTGRYVH